MAQLVWIILAIALTPSSGTADLAGDRADCSPQLLLLSSCIPFVQGSLPAPAQTCCSNVLQVYSDMPKCLCLLMADSSNSQSALSALAINQTLALHLPGLCDVSANISRCPGLLHFSPGSPESKIFGSSNVDASATPAPVGLPPVTSLRYGSSDATWVKSGTLLVLTVVTWSLIQLKVS